MSEPLPPQTCFLFRIDELEPKFDAQEMQHDDNNLWMPPDRSDEFSETRGRLRRWCDGNSSAVAPDTLHDEQKLDTTPGSDHHVKSVTMFTRVPDDQHFCVVPYDAREQNVCNHGNWHLLGFDHVPHPECPQGLALSRIGVGHGERTVAGQLRFNWVEQLLTTQYHWPIDIHTATARTNAGLMGDIAVIIALAAFSAPKDRVNQVMEDCLKPGRWVDHNYGNGRDMFRGMVVSIWEDRASTTRANTLRRLENGDFGAFIKSCP